MLDLEIFGHPIAKAEIRGVLQSRVGEARSNPSIEKDGPGCSGLDNSGALFCSCVRYP